MAGIWFDHARYDGFGNLTAKTGTGGAPSFSATIDAATNRWAGVSHDANGNQLYAPMMAGMPNAFTLGYDVSNRMTLAWNGYGGKKNEYEYDPGNKRVTEVNYTANGSGDWVKDGEVLHFFGITGPRLATYSVGVMNEGYSTAAVILTQSGSWVWFGGKLAQNNGAVVSEDRLGSVGKYLPYGEEKPGATGNPANGTVKFATYVRDAVTGIDYADQRWHTPGAGRFLTADPYQASAGPEDPGSWNRYGYVQGDPIGFNDPSGLDIEFGTPIEWCVAYDVMMPRAICAELTRLGPQAAFSAFPWGEEIQSWMNLYDQFAACLQVAEAATGCPVPPQISDPPSWAQGWTQGWIRLIADSLILYSRIQENEILRQAKEDVRYKGPRDFDRLCSQLQALYDSASTSAEKKKIEQAMKFAGCKNVEKDRSGGDGR